MCTSVPAHEAGSSISQDTVFRVEALGHEARVSPTRRASHGYDASHSSERLDFGEPLPEQARDEFHCHPYSRELRWLETASLHSLEQVSRRDASAKAKRGSEQFMQQPL